MVIQIREVRREELPVVRELEHEYTDSSETAEQIEARFEHHPSLFVVAVDGEGIVGEASGRLRGDRVGLKAIAVKDEHQRRGIGRRLLAEFEARARCYADTVDVGSADDENVERFYLACGFHPESLRVSVPLSIFPDEYRLIDYPISAERDEDDHRFFYVKTPDYDPHFKEAVRVHFRATSVLYIFKKDLSERVQ